MNGDPTAGPCSPEGVTDHTPGRQTRGTGDAQRGPGGTCFGHGGMFHSSIIWDDEADPLGNVQHIAEHDLSVADVEAVLASPVSEGHSTSTGLPAVWGHVPDGRFVIVVYDEVDADTVRVITAYEVPEPRRRSKRKKN